MNQILKSLGIKQLNSGACIGGNDWINQSNHDTITSYNPSNGKELAKVFLSNENDYKEIISSSNLAFKEWRMVPAPIRGQLILEMATYIELLLSV